LDHSADFILARLTSAPQTNEVRRSAALYPGFTEIARRYPLPFRLSELGCSAGLNLLWDHYQIQLGNEVFGRQADVEDPVLLPADWTGPALIRQNIHIAERRGVDLNPLDITQPDQAQRLLSYVWSDQLDRLARARSAIALFSKNPPAIDRGDAIEWLANRLDSAPAQQVHVVYHSIAWQYFPEERQRTGKELMETAGARATADRPLAWLRLESDGGEYGAGLRLTCWPGGKTELLGRADFHGRWVEWVGPS
jgi:hypothetical protein